MASHPDHARGGHRAARAAAGRGGLRAEALGDRRRWTTTVSASELIAKVKGLARLRRRAAAAAGAARAPRRAPPARARPAARRPPQLLAIGSSTGGPQALFTLIAGAGARRCAVPVVITQHMPPTFTAILAEHITALGGLALRGGARTARRLAAGPHLSRPRRPAPAGRGRPATAGALRARLSDAPAGISAAPRSIRCCAAPPRPADGRVLVAMLTGMGHDGLAGTRAVVAAGGTAIAQDEATSVVWGMPGAIAQAGLCHARAAAAARSRRNCSSCCGAARRMNAAALQAAAFETFAELLRARSGLVIGPDKIYLLETRLAPIAAAREAARPRRAGRPAARARRGSRWRARWSRR